MNIFLQIFIYFDILLIGALIPFAVRHALAHFKPQKHAEEANIQAGTGIPEIVQARLINRSETEYQTVLDRTLRKLQFDLASSSEQINGLLKQFAGEIIGEEMEKYRLELGRLHKQAETDLSGIRTVINGHQAEIETRMAKELAEEKQALLKRIDTHLGDAVASFLVETLQHNVDLGAQHDYLLQMLEEHKEELKQGVVDEVQPAK